MIEFLQNYGLWIALVGVFAAMQWVGMGCCGRHQHGLMRRSQGPVGGNPKDKRASGAAAESNETSR